MQEKTGKKLSRASVATVLAASSVALGLPMQPNAAITFKDVKVTDFFYSSVYELANQKVINGYTDGTFRPNKNVTRGEAAKMLALSLKLDVTNATTKQFKDINSKNIYYKYIAALANKGIINGMPDGTFRPDEPVLRGAMAKMVALGYEYTLAKQLTHSFEDVPSVNIFSYHIQTLVNLGITKGTSAIQFSPNKPVTRGELATFIARANKVEVGKPTYVVDNIVGNKIYINSVGYTIGPNISKYIKAENKSALIGAHIEGTFTSNTLTAISKLTINATGTAKSVYTLDGGKSTFNGDLILNGSYIRIQNWTLNGQTIVSETPRKSLASYNRIDFVRVASLTGTGIIDWNTPTNPDDGNLNNGPDSGNLNSGTAPSKVYNAKLSPILKYIDFSNSTVKNLIIEQSGSYIKATTTLPKVTIRRDVEFAEINANMTNLYLEGDESLTLYGKHDINTAYKKTYYSVFFNTNSKVKTMIVENSNGWIDLGDFFTVDKVILPPKTTPNDVFDDYKNDNDNIGKIVDDTGKDVDRNPIENGVIPDVTKPIIKSITTVPDSNRVTFTVTVNEEGLFKYLILPKGSPVPTVREIVNPSTGASSGTVTVNNASKIEEGKYVFSKTQFGLEQVKDYVLYGVQIDNAGNYSASYAVPFATKDGTPPRFETASAQSLHGGRRISFSFKPSETGTYYYFLRAKGDDTTTVTVDEVIRIGSKTPISGTAATTGRVTEDIVKNGLTAKIYKDENGNDLQAMRDYVLYAALVDDSGNKIVNVHKSSVRTSELDSVLPYVTGPKDPNNPSNILAQNLVPATAGSTTQFYLYFSEKVDKNTAENVNNYELSGTGIINVPGQARIKPSKVVYEESANRVLITIPSTTGFVNGDTLRVTVLPGVVDLAENPFESLATVATGTYPRNYAEYKHVDTEKPNILNLKVLTNTEKTTSEIEYTPTKAGFIYYMIMPSDTNITNITSRDFVDEFNTSTATGKFDLFGDKIYLEGSINALPSRLSAEFEDVGNNQYKSQKFTYDIDKFKTKLDPFKSYNIYMVLQDRSGLLSQIEKAPIITDIKAPFVTSYTVKPERGEKENTPINSEAKINVTVDEGGILYYIPFKKYIKDDVATANAADGETRYKLNDVIYDASDKLKTLPGTDKNGILTDRQREEYFKQYGATAVEMETGTNSIPVNGLDPNSEYVFYLAVKDTIGNFTIRQQDMTLAANNVNQPSGGLMIQEVYTDYTVPSVVGEVMERNYDDSFTITFTESIMRKYADTALLNQISRINSDALTLDKILTLKDDNGVDVTKEYKLRTYTEGRTIESESTLIIEKAQDSTSVNRTINVIMGENDTTNVGTPIVSTPDQSINLNYSNRFDLTKNVKYVYRNLTAQFMKIKEASSSKEVSVIFDIISPLSFDSKESLNYYYVGASAGTTDFTPYTEQAIIESVTNANNTSLGNLAKGKGTVEIDGSRAEFTMTNSVSFINGDYVIMVVEDKYGNRIVIKGKVGYEFVSTTN